MPVLNREDARDTFRQAVLEAMDKAAREIFGPAVTRNDCGATDADLPQLFQALDAQLETVAERFGCTLVDYQP